MARRKRTTTTTAVVTATTATVLMAMTALVLLPDTQEFKQKYFTEFYSLDKNGNLNINRYVNINATLSIFEINQTIKYFSEIKNVINPAYAEIEKIEQEAALKLNLKNSLNKTLYNVSILNITETYFYPNETHIIVNKQLYLKAIYSKEQIDAEVKKYELNKSSEDYLLWNARQNNYNLLAVKI